MLKDSTLACTRLHRQHAKLAGKATIHCEDVKRTVAFIGRVVTEDVADVVAVAVDVSKGGDLLAAVEAALANRFGDDLTQQFSGRIKILPISFWGNIVQPLNALLAFALQNGYQRILYMSAEVAVSKGVVEQLHAHLNDDTLVVGAVMHGHNFMGNGEYKLNGCTSPWNTLALWKVVTLAMTGFLMVAEGLDGIPGGVEEVTAISLLQKLHKDKSRAKLVLCSGLTWDTTWSTEDRRQWHEEKMASKISRPEAQLKLLGLLPGRVVHIDCR